MTLDEERFHSIEGARLIFERMLRERPFPYTKTELRETARRRLRHFPEPYFLERLKSALEVLNGLEKFQADKINEKQLYKILNKNISGGLVKCPQGI